MCGIQVDGENHFVIAPLPGGSLTDAGATYQSLYGKVAVAWKKEEKNIAYEIEIPANTTAQVLLPDGRQESLGTGKYNF